MAKLPTKIRITDLSTKWGLVTLVGDEGEIVHQFMITGVDAEMVKTQHLSHPPGATLEEWQSGRMVIHTKCCFTGQAVVNPGGNLMVNHGIHEEGPLIRTEVMIIPQEEWTLLDGIVYIEEDVLRDMPLIQKG